MSMQRRQRKRRGWAPGSPVGFLILSTALMTMKPTRCARTGARSRPPAEPLARPTGGAGWTRKMNKLKKPGPQGRGSEVRRASVTLLASL